MDLVDFQTKANGKYHWVLHYQDNMTKFCYLAPFMTKTAVKVAERLDDAFGLIKAPLILQSDNGREFCNSVMRELVDQ